MNNKTVRLILGVSLNAIAIVFVIFFIYTVGTKGFAFGAKVFDEQPMNINEVTREVEVIIPEGVTTKQLAQILYSKGLIEDLNVFYVQVELSDYKKKFVAGTYTLSNSMKPTELMAALSVSTASENSTEN